MEQPGETTPPQQQPPPQASLISFIQSLKAPPEASAPKPGDVSKPFDEKGPLFHHFAEFSWTLQQNQWLKFSFIAHCALALLIWGGVFLAFTRPTYMQIGSPTLEEAAKDYYKTDYKQVDPGLVFDQMSYFTITTLQYLYQVNPRTPTPIELLKGMVNPDIITRTKKRFDKERPFVEKRQVYQNLVINAVLPPIINQETGTEAVFVGGNIIVALQSENGDAINRVIPYRAKVILRETPVSALNPFPFTVEELVDVFGDDAVKKWDQDNERFFK